VGVSVQVSEFHNMILAKIFTLFHILIFHLKNIQSEIGGAMKDETLVKARAILRDLWKSAQLRGRCWGLPKKVAPEQNPYYGSHVTLANNGELVSITQGPDGKLIFHEFAQISHTALGNKIREILRKKGLSFE
jgi:hypothetical protein